MLLNIYPKEFNGKNIIFIDGKKLAKVLHSNNIQFVWGVLSGFKKDVNIDINNLDVIPFVDGNSSLWTKDVRIQHPLATVEIVCFDSSCTLLLSNDRELLQRFHNVFTDAKDLIKYNLG